MTIGPHSPAIEVRCVRHSFGDTLVLDGVDLTVEQGTVFALLGPNGAGKTTIVRMLATLLSPDEGDLSVLGHDPIRETDRVRSVIGVTGQFAAIDDLLTGRENLRLIADLLHLPRDQRGDRVESLLARFDLLELGDRPAATYSGGQRRRLDLALTLVGSPTVIFLDEPTTGLDPRSRRTMWDSVRELADGGVTILLTTQYLEEADQLADRVAVLDRGKVVAEGTPAELKRRVSGGHVELGFGDPACLAAAAGVLDVPSVDEASLTLRVSSDGSVAGLRTLLNRLDTAGVEVETIDLRRPDLDDVFFAVTGDPRTGSGESQPSVEGSVVA